MRKEHQPHNTSRAPLCEIAQEALSLQRGVQRVVVLHPLERLRGARGVALVEAQNKRKPRLVATKLGEKNGGFFLRASHFVQNGARVEHVGHEGGRRGAARRVHNIS